MLSNEPSQADICDVRPVRSRSELRQFAGLPRRLHGGDPVWVQPLKLQDFLLDRDRHPFYDHGRGASAEFFLARDGSAPGARAGRVVGRIAAIVDHRHNEHDEPANRGELPVGHFGFFDCVNSTAVSRRLLAAAADWLRSQGMRRMLGPASPSQSYDYGLLVEGHDRPHRFFLPYHPAYCAGLLEECGLSKAKDLVSLSLDLQDPDCRTRVEEFIERTGAMAERRSRDVTIRAVDMRRFGDEARLVRQVVNAVLTNNWGYTPIGEVEWRLLTDSLRLFLNPDFLLIAERAGRPIGATLAVPDLNELIRRLRLRWGPLESLELLARARRWRPECMRVVVAGVANGADQFGVAPLLVRQLARNLLAHRIHFVDAHLVVEDNRAILDPLLRHGFVADRRYRVYQMAL